MQWTGLSPKGSLSLMRYTLYSENLWRLKAFRIRQNRLRMSRRSPHRPKCRQRTPRHPRAPPPLHLSFTTPCLVILSLLLPPLQLYPSTHLPLLLPSSPSHILPLRLLPIPLPPPTPHSHLATTRLFPHPPPWCTSCLPGSSHGSSQELSRAQEMPRAQNIPRAQKVEMAQKM